MGQKTSPTGFRIGIRLDWQSTWYTPKVNYGDLLVEDQRIRAYIDRKFNRQPPYAAISKITIARTRNEVKVTLHTARPGMVIGPRGAEVDKLREELEHLIGRKITINVIEIKEPALDAKLVSEAIAEQMKKRASFRRVMKMHCESAMNAGAKGVKIICSGRLGGSEMARKETQKLGSIPLHTLDANVDYAVATAKTTYGTVGVKVWIYKGKFGEELPELVRRPRRSRPRRVAPTSRPTGAPIGSVQVSSAGKGDAGFATKEQQSTSGESAKPDEGQSDNNSTEQV